MKNKMQLFLTSVLLLCLSLVSFLPQNVIASAKTDSTIAFVEDDAALFSDSEVEKLNAKLQSVANKHNINMALFTIRQTDGTDLYDYMTKLSSEYSLTPNAVIMIINMDPTCREVLIKGLGIVETYVNSNRAQYMTDYMVSDLKHGNYYDAGVYFTKKTDYFLKHKNPVPRTSTFIISGIAALVISGIVVLVMVANAGGKDTTTCNTYMDTSTSKILAKRDIYTHTTTTRTKIESNNGGGGSGSHGGGGGHSAGRSSF